MIEKTRFVADSEALGSKNKQNEPETQDRRCLIIYFIDKQDRSCTDNLRTLTIHVIKRKNKTEDLSVIFFSFRIFSAFKYVGKLRNCCFICRVIGWSLTSYAVVTLFPTARECSKNLPVTEQRQKSGRELPASSHTVAGQKGVKITVILTA